MFCCTLPGVKRTPEPAQPTVLIVAQPATGFPPGCSSVASCARSPTTGPAPFDRFASYKTLSYWPQLCELQVAASKCAAEALVVQVNNYLAGGCVSNTP
ncbi:MAG: hypothetical protein AMXMBFR58_30050 [Phycisphaerae bacterium]